MDASEEDVEGRRATVSVSELLVTTKMHAIANMNKKSPPQNTSDDSSFQSQLRRIFVGSFLGGFWLVFGCWKMTMHCMFQFFGSDLLPVIKDLTDHDLFHQVILGPFGGRYRGHRRIQNGFVAQLQTATESATESAAVLLTARTWTECDTLVDGHRLRIFNRWHGSQILALNQILAVKNGEFLSDLQVFEP